MIPVLARTGRTWTATPIGRWGSASRSSRGTAWISLRPVRAVSQVLAEEGCSTAIPEPRLAHSGDSPYDFVVVDEVQDLTRFNSPWSSGPVKAGPIPAVRDSNQIVHPNFFSWTKVKTLLQSARRLRRYLPAELIRILNTNFRNSPEATEIANRLLHVKHARFGSVDRESNYLVVSRGPRAGRVGLLADTEAVKRDLDRAHRRLLPVHPVLHEDQKAEGRRAFSHPLGLFHPRGQGSRPNNLL